MTGPGVGSLLLGQPDMAEMLMRALEVKGDLPQFLDALFQPTIQLDDFRAPEYHFLRRMQRFNASVFQAPVAAQVSQFQLTPNASRAAIAAIDDVYVTNTNAAAADYLIGLTSGGAGGTGASSTTGEQDDRMALPSPGFGAFQVRFGTAAAKLFSSINLARYVRVPANTTVLLPNVGFVLTGKVGAGGSVTALTVETDQVNIGGAVTFAWRERAIVSGEL